jgi:hypothetical protein
MLIWPHPYGQFVQQDHVQFGLDKVVDAIEEVAYNVGDTDEIGSSDVSGWVRQVKQILGADA